MKAKEIRALSASELDAKLVELKKELFAFSTLPTSWITPTSWPMSSATSPV